MKGLAEAIAAIRNSPDGLSRAAVSYSIASGRMVGGVPERETRLDVKGNGEAVLFRRRPGADTPALPPGLFRGRVETPAFLDFLDWLDRSGIDAFRPAEAPSPRDSLRRLQVVADGRFFSFQWGPMPPAAPSAIKEMLNILSGWESSACPEPAWRLGLKVLAARSEAGGLKAGLRIENTGPETIYVAHPASPTDRGLLALTLRYGSKPPKEPGVTPLPLSIKTVRAAFPPLESLQLVPVTPGAPLVLEVELPLEALDEGRPTGMFILESYLASDTLAGLPVFNGAVFSEEFTW